MPWESQRSPPYTQRAHAKAYRIIDRVRSCGWATQQQRNNLMSNGYAMQESPFEMKRFSV
jgi:hypothetical protein